MVFEPNKKQQQTKKPRFFIIINNYKETIQITIKKNKYSNSHLAKSSAIKQKNHSFQNGIPLNIFLFFSKFTILFTVKKVDNKSDSQPNNQS